ncbi:hypothetical protein GQ55_5G005300 [Panicum hallii var. hallii]|uniref:Uncharacterized protein n=1 Tax=Panicum hallii var. hallii TaxID=1504633 RepID=A0A2T7DBB0_9POAL|nr:hypothetical protein GQ55_5G005300 [Panicum hallii var. hallii]
MCSCTESLLEVPASRCSKLALFCSLTRPSHLRTAVRFREESELHARQPPTGSEFFACLENFRLGAPFSLPLRSAR